MKLTFKQHTTKPNNPLIEYSADFVNSTDLFDFTEKIKNADIDDAAAIVESKLNLNYPTHENTSPVETDPVFVASEAHNFVSGDKNKLDGIQAGAQVNVSSDWLSKSGSTAVLHKPLVEILFSTGLVYGGIISQNISDPSKFDISAGFIVKADPYSDPNDPTTKIGTWALMEGLTDDYLSIPLSETNIALNINGSNVEVIQSQIPFTREQSRDYAVLGKNVHPFGQVYPANTPSLAFDFVKCLEEFLYFFGIFNCTGNVYYANGANLNLNKTGGSIFARGLNYAKNRKDPNICNVNSFDTIGSCELALEYRGSNGVWGTVLPPPIYEIDPNHYDDNSGTLASVPAGKWTVQYIFLYYSDFIITTPVVFGQSYYDTSDGALANLQSTDLANFDTENLIFRGYLIVQQGCTELNDPAKAIFRPAGKFGLLSTVSASAGGEANTASNIGTTGVGFFDQKLGEDLQFKKLKSSSGLITIVDSPSDHTVNLGLNINCDNISDGTNTHLVSTAEKTVIDNTSNTNTGDETETTIKSKLGISTLSGSNTGDQDLSGKVDKVAGKELSTNDLTNGLKSNYDTAYADAHVHSNEAALDNVSGTNTGDQDLSGKVDKISGKGLSTNDLTNALKTNYDTAYTHSQSSHLAFSGFLKIAVGLTAPDSPAINDLWVDIN